MDIFENISFVIVVLCIAKIGHIVFQLTFWKRLGVRGPIPIPIFGNWIKCIMGKRHPAELAKDFYDQYENEKIIGVYQNHTPMLILKDESLIKDVLIRDFNSFSDRGVHVHEHVEPLSHHFFTMKNDIWQPIKRRVGTVFTTTNIKEQLENIWNIAEVFCDGVDISSDSSGVDCIKAMTKLMYQVLGSWGLGLNISEFEVLEAAFQRMSIHRRTSNVFNISRRFLRENFPWVFKYCSKIYKNHETIAIYLHILEWIEESRKSQNNDRKDYMGLLLELRNKVRRIGDRYLSNELLAAQVYLLFTAGAESTALVLSKAMYEIAKSDLVQNTLRREIKKEVLQSGETLFEKLRNMNYLDTVIKEPTSFNPERFRDKKDENTRSIPFGLGSRYCIGSKLADAIMKIVIIVMVKNFKLTTQVSAMGRNYAERTFLEPVRGLRIKFERYIQ